MLQDKFPRVLIVEDDERQSLMLSKYLAVHQYEVIAAKTGQQALRELHQADVVILDVNLPDMNGFEILAHIREQKNHIPVLMLSVLSDTPYKVRGLKGGADDYLPKPYDLLELEARVEALIRRKAYTEQLQFDGLLIDRTEHQVKVGEQTLELSKLELDFLWLMAQKPEKAFSREELLENVWGPDFDGVERVVDVMVVALRKKLGRNYLETVRGIGYRFNPAPV
ncbi:response regulator transcription factor [Deinococcus misasensis]|uniref:response regulator transcription factor n=1 Tax=Deinococcus misasensis TaxID=392413 RepID=UPI00054DC971|nr:response regulator transcription factor [Deinococcus misasensis]